jgi:hypothetical protein
MKKFIFLLLLLLNNVVFAQDICPSGVFSDIASSPINAGFRTVSYGDDIFAFGPEAFRYSTTNNTWTSIANMPTVRGEVGAAEIEGIIYCLGGFTGSLSNKNEAYDVSTNSWVTKANLPVAMAGCMAVSLNNKIYILGGGFGNTVTSFFEYNPVTNSYVALALPTQNRMHAGLVEYNGKIYLVGGHFYNGAYNSSNKLDEYDPSTNVWTSKANLPLAIQRTHPAVYDNKIFLFGGTALTPTLTPTNHFMVYDFQTDTWSTMPEMPFLRASFDAKTVNSDIYLFGGHINASTYTNQCHKYSCVTCSDVTVTDTQTIFVSDVEFETQSPKTYFESTENLTTAFGGCDSIVNHFTEYVFDPTYCSETVLITVTDTLVINYNMTSLNPLSYESTIKIYPNPTSDYLTIAYGNTDVLSGHRLIIQNSLGEMVFEDLISQPISVLSVDTLGAVGLYFVQLQNSLGEIVETRKIVLQ